MTREEFGKWILILQAGIGREFNNATIEVWFRILEDLDVVDFAYSVDRYLSECTSAFPTPAQLRVFADVRRNGEVLDPAEAFIAVKRAIREFGSYRAIEAMKTLDSMTKAALEVCGGFVTICQAGTDQQFTIAAQFRRAYEAISRRHVNNRRLPEALRPENARTLYQKRYEHKRIGKQLHWE